MLFDDAYLKHRIDKHFERCLEMQRKRGSTATAKSAEGQTLKKSKKTTCSCPYLNPQRVQDIRDISLTEVVDVENLVQSGKKHKACPYYASRKALTDAQVRILSISNYHNQCLVY